MSTTPRTADRKRVSAPDDATASAADAPKISLAKRLPDMSDYQLSAYQASANRISRDPAHPKNATAIRSIPMIEAEIRRRADGLRSAPVKETSK